MCHQKLLAQIIYIFLFIVKCLRPISCYCYCCVTIYLFRSIHIIRVCSFSFVHTQKKKNNNQLAIFFSHLVLFFFLCYCEIYYWLLQKNAVLVNTIATNFDISFVLLCLFRISSYKYIATIELMWTKLFQSNIRFNEKFSNEKTTFTQPTNNPDPKWQKTKKKRNKQNTKILLRQNMKLTT